MPSPKLSLARALTTQPTTQTNRNTKAEGKPLWPYPLRNSRSPSKSCGTSRARKGLGRSGARPVTHAPGAPPAHGFLQEVIKGWYIRSRPEWVKREHALVRIRSGVFVRVLEARFGVRWCLSPEQSLSLHAGNGPCPASSRRGRRVRQQDDELRMARPCWSFALHCTTATGRKRPACGCSVERHEFRALPQLFFEQRDGCPRRCR